jgi:hypothetical protein
MGFGAYSTALHYSEQQRQRARASYAYRNASDLRPQQYLISRSGIPAAIESVISNPQPASGQDHEKRDLAAQEASATFAWWMVVISGLGFGTTAIGTFLLFKQIRLTRKAVEDTGNATKAMMRQNEIANDAVRPWLRLTPPKTATLKKGMLGDGVECWAGVIVDIDLKNFGQSPAILPQACAMLFIFRGHFDRLAAQGRLFKEMDVTGFASEPIYPNDSDNVGHKIRFGIGVSELIGVTPNEMIMVIGVRYKQTGRDRIFHLTSCFSLKSSDDNAKNLENGDLFVTLDHIKGMTEAT